MRDGDPISAVSAFKDVFASGTRFRQKGGSRITFDPATGATIIPIELGMITGKALKRSARGIAFRAYLFRTRLSLKIFLMKRRSALFLTRRHLCRLEAKNPHY